MRLRIHPTRAVVILTVMILVVMVTSISYLLWDMRQRDVAQARLKAVGLTEILLEQTKQSFNSADLVLLGVQERLLTAYGRQFSLDSPPTRLLLGARMLGMRQISALFLVDSRGQVVNSSSELRETVSVSDSAYYRAFAEGKTQGLYIGAPQRSWMDGSWTLFLARELKDDQGKFRGVVVAAVSVQRLEQLLSILKLESSNAISLYLLDGTLIASQPRRENLIGAHAPEVGEGPFAAAEEGVQSSSHRRGDGSQQSFALGRVADFPLLVSVTNDELETLASWRETAIPITMGAAMVCLLIVFTSVLLVSELRKEEALANRLRDANNRYHRTIDSVMDAIVAADEEQNIIFFNPAAERMFAIKASDAIGAPLERLMPERLRGSHRGHVAGFAQSQDHSRRMGPQLDIMGVRADGTEFPIESTISHMELDGKRQFTAVLRDVTDRRRAETDMREMNQQLRALSASLQEVREQERKRISRELHDDLGQKLTGLKLDLAWLHTRLKDGRPLQPDAADGMRLQLDEAIASVRQISTDLRPPILDDLGFGEAVAWLAGELAKRSGLEISLDLEATSLVHDEALSTALFRVVQEALTNVVRHAQATKVLIELAADDKDLVLTVRDNGRGLAPERRESDAGQKDAPERRRGGIGLVSMRERVEAFGGRLQVSSTAGQGTRVEVKISLGLPVISGEPA